MNKNRIKDFLDLTKILSLVLIIIINKIPYTFIFLGIFILVIIIDRLYWKCKKCNKPLPNKMWFSTVQCCPYCKSDIDK